MKTAVETLEPTRVKLTVEVPEAELASSLAHAYEHIGSQLSVPGFRKGKIPARVIEQRVGKAAVIEHAINDALPQLYRQAVQEADLRPLGQPEIDVTSAPGVGEGTDLSFTAEVDVRPEISIPSLAEVTLEVPEVEVSDDDVAQSLLLQRQRLGTLVGVDRPAQDGDFVSIDLSAKIGDETIDSVSGVSYEIGSGTMLPGLDEALVGLSAGQSASFEAPLAGGDRAGQNAEVDVTVESVKERELPEADDDFAQTVSEFDTLAELEADLREQVGRAKRNNQAVQARDSLLDYLVQNSDFPLPQGIIDAEVNRHLEAEGRLADDEHRAEVSTQTEEALRRQLLLDVLSESTQVQVGQDELLEYLLSVAQQQGTDPNTFIQEAASSGNLASYSGELARTKALVQTLRDVAVRDAAGNEVDLSPYLGEESPEDESTAALQDALAQAQAEIAAESEGAADGEAAEDAKS